MNQVVAVIPTFNEETHIKETIEDIYRGSPYCRIWIVDGGSTDSTVEKVKELNIDQVKIFDNPKRNQASALNLAAEHARRLGDVNYLIRIDAHATYPDNFIETLIDTMKAESSDSVVVSMRTLGGNAVQDAASALFSHWLGNGGSPHRSNLNRGFVEHGHHAAFRLASFLGTGGYDERFSANEDAEFDIRFIKAGYKIFLENRAQIGYVPRDSHIGFWHQMFRNGSYRIMTAVKHQIPLNLRQLLPTMVAPILIFSALFSISFHPIFITPLILYILLVAILSVNACQGCGGTKYKPFRVMLLAMICHNAFSLGAIYRLYNLFISNPMRRHALRKNHSIQNKTDRVVRANLFLCAAPRSGSTQLVAWLGTHPDIDVSKVKEPNFFSQHEFQEDYVRINHLNDIDPEIYLKKRMKRSINFSVFRTKEQYDYLFENMQTKYRFEASTTYLHCPEAPFAIKKYNPDAKIIILLRDPVKRALSHYRLTTRMGKKQGSLKEELENELRGKTPLSGRYLLRQSIYETALRNFKSVFAEDQLLELSFENLFKNPDKYICEICDFLGIKKGVVDLSIKDQNAGDAPRFPLINKFLQYTGTKNIGKRLLHPSAKKIARQILFSHSQDVITQNYSDFELIAKYLNEAKRRLGIAQ